MTTKILLTVAVIFPLLLTACASREQIEAQERQYQLEREREETLRKAKLAMKCDSYGFKRGTVQFAQCLQQAEQQQSIDNAIQMQNNELQRQEQQRTWRRTQCYASGRLDC